MANSVKLGLGQDRVQWITVLAIKLVKQCNLYLF